MATADLTRDETREITRDVTRTAGRFIAGRVYDLVSHSWKVLPPGINT